MRPSQFISKSQKYNYGVDKLFVTVSTDTFYATPSDTKLVKELDLSYFDLEKQSRRIKRRGSGYIYTKTLHLNGNRIMRDLILGMVPDKRLYSKCDFRHDDNCVPSGARAWMIENGISMASLRKKAINIIYSEIEAAKEELKTMLDKCFMEDLDYVQIKTAILSCEINFDCIQAPGVSLATDPKVIKAFNFTADSMQQGYFNEKQGFRAKSSVVKEVSIKDRDALRGFFRTPIKTVQTIIYIKEDGPFGSVNRTEVKIKKQNAASLFTSRTFDDLKDLKAMIVKMAEFSFDLIEKGCSEVTVSKTCNWKLLKQMIKMAIRTHWDTVYHLLKKFNRVSTRGTNLPRSLQEKIPKFANHKIIFCKLHDGVYSVDWENLLKAPQNLLRLKENERTKRLQKKSKSWLNTKDWPDSDYVQ